jgi:biotin carboxylase
MTAHVLLVGANMDLPRVLRESGPEVRTSIIARMSSLTALVDPTGNRHIFIMPNGSAPSAWVKIAQAVHQFEPITAVTAVTEKDQDKAAAIARALGLPWHDPGTVASVYVKLEMRRCLQAAGVDTVPARVVVDEAAVLDFASEHGWPVILKPNTGTASVGVALARCAEDVSKALLWARDTSALDSWRNDLGDVLAERFLEGDEISVEAFSEGGRHVIVAVTGKVKDPVHQVELGHVIPRPLPAPTYEAVERLLVGALNALGIAFGMTHTEMILTRQGPRMVETHIRGGGDEITRLVRDVTGVHLEGMTAKQVLGHRVLPEISLTLAAPQQAVCAAVWFVTTNTFGVLRSVEGVEEAHSLAGVEAVTVLHPMGTCLEPGLSSSFDRLAVVRVRVVGTPELALLTAQRAASLLTFVFETRASNPPPLASGFSGGHAAGDADAMSTDGRGLDAGTDSGAKQP